MRSEVLWEVCQRPAGLVIGIPMTAYSHKGPKELAINGDFERGQVSDSLYKPDPGNQSDREHGAATNKRRPSRSACLFPCWSPI